MKKKKVSFITIFDNPNFGTYLQALALGLMIEKLGAKAEVVHYERPIWHVFPKWLLKYHFLEPLYLLKAYLRKSRRIIQQNECRRFVSKYINITRTFYSYEELVKNPPRADIYMTGSDQVWNTIHNHGVDKAFYLGYAPNGTPKYAYAASIGMSNIPAEFVDQTRNLLSKYSRISVRESSNIDLLASIGIKSEQVLDPTLLLNREEWSKYARSMDFKEPYLLVYSVESQQRDAVVGEIAQKIARAKGLKIYEVNYFGENKMIPGCDKHFFYATPDLFLSLVLNASFVVVSSFHGTAFSINFNKEFLSVAPDCFSSRLDGILNMTGLESRKVSSVDDVSENLLDSSIDYSSVNSRLKIEREKSINFLKQQLR